MVAFASSKIGNYAISSSLQRPSATKFSSFKQPILLKDLQQLAVRLDISKAIKNASVKLVDAFVDFMFEFVDQPLLPSQSNFGPIDELKEAVNVSNIEGQIPDDFPEGVYIRNGPNPLFGGLKSTASIFGKTGHIWIEGEGMLHAIYFNIKESKWSIVYDNRHVESETYLLEKKRNKPSFLPAIDGDSPAILLACLLNQLRFGKVNKYLSNTNVFEHSGKFYSISENHIPQEIDIFTLQTLGNWDVNGAWSRPFSSHPKKAPGSGELVTVGVDAIKPFVELGVISADGKRLVHKTDLKFKRCTLCHDFGVTENYNVLLDFPLTIDIQRLIRGGPLVKFDKEEYARIGVMPRYGNADSICWFDVDPCCTFHILNCFEQGDEVIVRGFRSLESILSSSKSDIDMEKCEWVAGRLRNMKEAVDKILGEYESLTCRCYEWRLNMKTGNVEERNLTGTQFSMEFPMINAHYLGLPNYYGYTQVVHVAASSASGMPKFGALAKLHFEGPNTEVEYHKFEEKTFCTGATFICKEGNVEEDDGWIITFVHHEDTHTSQVYIIDAKNFSDKPVAKITLPCRVPYGFHGAFMPMPISLTSF
ncbi:carotenoid 9,10(9',10')-cleavage dioxygenase-like [Mercurialis annua]|uniref:carotenoid 9,10(9',10')-cleavage dioxygenase-like n=1 Tax=Mercurialis annua TaxID=3986 RepID=UPI00215E72C1|nr:carotenoid 9,10(9',10')-cleavage dioxygenase-like [Mercurialis annua]